MQFAKIETPRRSRSARGRAIFISALLGCTSIAGGAVGQTYDLAILHGRVMDPESGLDGLRNVAVSQGKIVRVTRRPIRGRSVIDASGLVVAPGFIDLHAHDHSPLTHRLHAQDGVTTALELENGAFPVRAWYASRIGVSAINFGVSASHGVIRAIALTGLDERRVTGDLEADIKLLEGKADWQNAPSDAAERLRMIDLVGKELDDGAVGVGYHLATTPGADTAELSALFAAAAQRSAPNFIHIRSVGQVTPSTAAREVIAIAKSTGASVHIVHVNSSGLWDTADILTQVKEAQRTGLDVTTEAYPYTGAMTALDDPRSGAEGMATYRSSFHDLELVATGERLTAETYEAAKRRDPHGALIAHVMTLDNVDLALENPLVMAASDGEAYHDGKGHPRGAGTFSRIFSRYVREKQTVPLMQAIAKVSLMPARRLEAYVPDMKLRGRIQKGAIADITIFDADKIADRATYENPTAPSAGIAYVLVAGRAVVDRYRFQDGVKPGVPIYGAGLKAPAKR
ncbi:MAG: amidohydrolase family protein [Pseudomonadota bacterium]|uniref:amidohydrolase family protein n=1 Tax=Phenylobacterium sp. TaxID=1871053 RepID=UPI0025CD3266|nr:amidohydrolase family protein [Phenylobacterium sp.]MBT9469915.1 amidohydrolase family protein [Phenylobacterium sp.]